MSRTPRRSARTTQIVGLIGLAHQPQRQPGHAQRRLCPPGARLALRAAARGSAPGQRHRGGRARAACAWAARGQRHRAAQTGGHAASGPPDARRPGHRRRQHALWSSRTARCSATIRTPRLRRRPARPRVEPAGMHVLVLGAGGSARAVVYGLAAGRRRTRSPLPTARRRRPRPWPQTLQPHSRLLSDGVQPCLTVCTLAPQRRPDRQLHLAGHDAQRRHDRPGRPRRPFLRGQVVYDLVYNPPVTRLLAGRTCGRQAIGGLGMLSGRVRSPLNNGPAPRPGRRHARRGRGSFRRRERAEQAPCRPAGTVRSAQTTRRVSANSMPSCSSCMPTPTPLLQPPSATSFPAEYVLEMMRSPKR